MPDNSIGLEGSGTYKPIEVVGGTIYPPTGQVGALNYIHILQQVPSAIAFDISKSGTGWAKWENNQLTCGTFSMTGVDSNLEMRKHFRENVKNVYGESQFPYVVIEDVIGSVNFKTANILYQLNPIIDDLMAYGELPTGDIYREDNGTWRKHLKGLADYVPAISGFSDTKKIVQDCLDKMYVPRIWTNDNESDAIGMLIGTLAFRVLRFEYMEKEPKYSTNIRTGYVVKQYKTVDEVNKFLKPVAQEKIVYISELGVNTDIYKTSKRLLEKHGVDKCYVVLIETEKCTSLIVKNIDKGFTLDIPQSYIVFHHKKAFKKA